MIDNFNKHLVLGGVALFCAAIVPVSARPDGAGALADGRILFQTDSLRSVDIAVIVNINNPLSVEIGEYYRRARGLAAEQVVRVDLPNGANLPEAGFRDAFADVERQLPPGINGFVLTWTQPYRVDCMSITTAFATGFDDRYCPRPEPGQRCAPGGASPYFGVTGGGKAAGRDTVRPAIMLAAESFDDAKALIDRGVAADGTFPPGTAYLLSTSDKARTVRDQKFELVQEVLSARLRIEILQQDALTDRDDVMFYFTGKTHVAGLDTLAFRPGAVADHLTSFGGRMLPPGEGRQMSALRWLEAGATGSYGTVTEPCNFPQKFSDPGMLMAAYLQGDTLIEAYWKSVAWPGQGLFIGEPLAAPFRLSSIGFDGDSVELPAGRLRPGAYRLEVSELAAGPFRDTGRVVQVPAKPAPVTLTGLVQKFYRLRLVEN